LDYRDTHWFQSQSAVLFLSLFFSCSFLFLFVPFSAAWKKEQKETRKDKKEHTKGTERPTDPDRDHPPFSRAGA